MPVSRYDNPAIQNVQQQEAKGFTIPVELLQRHLEGKQRRYDETRQNIRDARNTLAVASQSRNIDKKRQTEILDEYDRRINNAVENAGGDYGAIQDEVLNIAGDFHRDAVSGEIGALQKSYNNEAQLNKDVQDVTKKTNPGGTPVYGQAEHFQNRLKVIKHEAAGGTTKREDGGYNTLEFDPVQANPDINTILDKASNGWKADKGYELSIGGKWIKHGTNETVPYNEVYNGLKTHLLNNNDVRNHIDRDFQASNAPFFVSQAAKEGYLEKGDIQSAQNEENKQREYLHNSKTNISNTYNQHISDISSRMSRLSKGSNEYKQLNKELDTFSKGKQYIDSLDMNNDQHAGEMLGFVKAQHQQEYVHNAIDPWAQKVSYTAVDRNVKANPYGVIAERAAAKAKEIPVKTNTVVTSTGQVSVPLDAKYFEKKSVEHAENVSNASKAINTYKQSLSPEENTKLRDSFNKGIHVNEFASMNPNNHALVEKYAQYIRLDENKTKAIEAKQNDETLHAFLHKDNSKIVNINLQDVKDPVVKNIYEKNIRNGVAKEALANPESAEYKELYNHFKGEVYKNPSKFLPKPSYEQSVLNEKDPSNPGNLTNFKNLSEEQKKGIVNGVMRNALRQYENYHNKYKESTTNTDTNSGFTLSGTNIQNKPIDEITTSLASNNVADAVDLSGNHFDLGSFTDKQVRFQKFGPNGYPMYTVTGKKIDEDGETSKVATTHVFQMNPNTAETANHLDKLGDTGKSMLIGDFNKNRNEEERFTSAVNSGRLETINNVTASLNGTSKQGLALMGGAAYGRDLSKLHRMAQIGDEELDTAKTEHRALTIHTDSGDVTVAKSGPDSYTIFVGSQQLKVNGFTDLERMMGIFALPKYKHYTKDAAKAVDGADEGSLYFGEE